ncbi:hypothetical protein LPJ66_001610 [Kickxella alabastrina]|uniref:Uncharacterized protein n=1 Tax=Kickxella alabastrina TaxID=61397 RepID=A0ACC1ISS1_9FUNG|nr:hypothetical protein LPJ66_001610 [Kickxella alabastrina]
MKDLSLCSTILSIIVHHISDGIKINQVTAIQNLVSKYGLEKANDVDLPIAASAKLGETAPHLSKYNATEYISIVGSLQYLAMATQPDIALVTSVPFTIISLSI